jgi:nucleoid-associated protein YgaU
MLQRPLIAGLIGVGLLAVGTTLAWMHLHQQEVAEAQPTVAATPASSAPSGAAATSAPARPPATAPAIIKPSFDVVRINPQGDAVMAGRAAPNAQVQIYDGQKRIGEVTADNRGEWVFVPNDPLPPGGRELSLSTRSSAGEVKSEQVVVLVVPERGRDLAGRPSAEATQPLAVATLRDGTGASTLLQGPARPADGAPRLSVDVVDYDTTGKLVLAGRAPPDTTVQIYIENRLVGRAQSNAAGRWMLIPEGTLPPGLYTLRLDELAPDGRVAMRIEIPFQRAEIESSDPAQTVIVVQPGDSLWRIARRMHGLGTAYTVIYEANKDQIRDPDLIYPGQVFSLTRTN